MSREDSRDLEAEHIHAAAKERAKRAEKLEGWAIAATLAWLLAWASIVLLGFLVPSIPSLAQYRLNEVGDLVAGIVSFPVLVWLVISYRQQAASLSLNSAEIALSVQELRSQARATGELAGQARRQLEPVIHGTAIPDHSQGVVQFSIENVGHSLKSCVLLDLSKGSPRGYGEWKVFELWASGTSRRAVLDIEHSQSDRLKGKYGPVAHCMLLCRSKGGSAHYFYIRWEGDLSLVNSKFSSYLSERDEEIEISERSEENAVWLLEKSGWEHLPSL